MARIRIRQQQVITPASAVAPRGTPDQFGAQEGQAIRQLGAAGMRMAAQQKREQDREQDQAEMRKAKLDNDKRILQDRLEWNKRERELADSADPEESPESHAKRVQQQFDQYRIERLSKMDGPAADDYANRMAALEENIVLRAQSRQAKLAGDSLRDFHDNSRDQIVNDLQRMDGVPMVDLLAYADEARSDLRELVQDIPGLNDAQRQAIIQRNNEILSESTLSTLIARGPSGAETALDLIETGGFDDTPPATLESIKTRARRTIEDYRQTASADYWSSVNAEIKQVQKTGVPTRRGDFSKSQFVAMAGDQEEGARRWEEYQSAVRIGHARQQYGWASAEDLLARERDLRQQVADAGDTPEASLRAVSELEALQRVRQERNKQLEMDPAGYATSGLPAVRARSDTLQAILSDPQTLQTPEGQKAARDAAASYITASREAQGRLGIPEDLRQDLPNSMVDGIKRAITEPQNTEDQYLAMQTYHSVLGGDVMAQVLGSDPSLKHMAIAGAMSPGDGRMLLMANSRLKENEALVSSTNKTAVKDAAVELIGDFASTTAYMNDNTASLMTEDIISLSYELMRRGETSAATAAETAAKKIVNDRYQFVQDQRGNVSARIPREAYTDGMDDAINAIAEQGVQSDLFLIPGADDTERQIYADALKDGNIRPQTAMDESGLNFTDMNGNMLFGKDGRPFHVSWQDLQRLAGPDIGRGGSLGEQWTQEALRNIGSAASKQEPAQATGQASMRSPPPPIQSLPSFRF